MKRIKNLNHPAFGDCNCLHEYLLILWEKDITLTRKKGLLKRNNLELVVRKEKEVLHDVNNSSDQLWWVKNITTNEIPDEVIKALESSEMTIWVAPVFSSKSGKSESMFAVNPTVLLTRESEVADGDGFELVAHKLGSNGSSKLNKMNISNASYLNNMSSIELAEKYREKKMYYRFENIPFFNPLCNLDGKSIRPDDALYAQQWGLEQIKAPYAWKLIQGDENIVVAVIDQGVQLDHPDLNLHPQSLNASLDTPDGSPVGNHGTPCAGIIGAISNNSDGVAGLSGGSQIMAIATSTWSDLDIAQGLYFATDNGAHVVSMSFGVYPDWNAWDFSIIEDALQYAHDRGVVLVAASGNENQNQSRFPGSDPLTICVGGTNREDLRKAVGDSSIEGFWGACFGPDLDVTAPCLEIPSTDRLGGLGYDPSDYTLRFNGTSSATPLVAGLAALIMGANRELDNFQVRNIIEMSCDKVRLDAYTYKNAQGRVNGTWNDEVGYGRINAERAITMACATEENEKDCKKVCFTPEGPEWLNHDDCMYFYNRQLINKILPRELDFPAGSRFQFLIEVEHCLRLEGMQHGGLLFTTTLLPQEEMKLYHYDRYLQTKSKTEALSVRSAFRQSVAATAQVRNISDSKTYQSVYNQIHTENETSVNVGGLMGSIFGGSADVESESSFSSEQLSTASLRRYSDQFFSVSTVASQQMEAKRSVVVSNFALEENRNATERKLVNRNECFAVTYFVRKINEMYSFSSRISSIKWRYVSLKPEQVTDWRDVQDLEGIGERLAVELEKCIGLLPKVGEEFRAKRKIAVPTDGVIYESELAHCSSLEPGMIDLQKARIESAHAKVARIELDNKLLQLEYERRKALLENGDLLPFQECATSESDSE